MLQLEVSCKAKLNGTFSESTVVVIEMASRVPSNPHLSALAIVQESGHRGDGSQVHPRPHASQSSTRMLSSAAMLQSSAFSSATDAPRSLALTRPPLKFEKFSLSTFSIIFGVSRTMVVLLTPTVTHFDPCFYVCTSLARRSSCRLWCCLASVVQ